MQLSFTFSFFTSPLSPIVPCHSSFPPLHRPLLLHLPPPLPLLINHSFPSLLSSPPSSLTPASLALSLKHSVPSPQSPGAPVPLPLPPTHAPPSTLHSRPRTSLLTPHSSLTSTRPRPLHSPLPRPADSAVSASPSLLSLLSWFFSLLSALSPVSHLSSASSRALAP
jgi:hypothetical protein